MSENNRILVGIDAAIIMNPRVWEASGHVATFTDPMVDCRNCKRRFRADHLEGQKQQREAHELARDQS
jgi:glycyl-tRNA synthetase